MNRYQKTLMQFAILIVCLIAGGLLMQHKVSNMLNVALEQTIARQTADMAVVAEERFGKELAQLRFAAKYISAHPDQATEINILKELSSGDSGINVGLIRLDGQALGMSLSKADFQLLPTAFSGNEIVDYCVGKGLLFAVPVMNGDNVRAIIYRLYADRLLVDMFSLVEYESDSRMLIQERSGQIIVPYYNYGTEDQAFFNDPTILAGFAEVNNKLDSSRSAAVYYEGTRGQFFLFGAKLPQTNCSIVGYIPWNAVAGTIARANIMIFIVTSSLLILFLIVSVYLFLLNEKAKKTDEFKKAKAEADQANQAKSAFLANMSHEIRTPINAVIGMNEMIIRESKEPDTLKYAANAHAASEALLSLINDILDFSKIESGKMELVEETYQLDDLINNLINMIKSRAEKKNLEFIVNVNENIPNELFGDSVRIRQVVVNFLTNAVKYTQVGRVTFNVEFDVYTPPNLVEDTPTEDKMILLMFSVKDTGIGIREEDRAKLFKDFERFDNKKNKDIEGTGLGLAITSKLVNMMKGHILVESVYGEGSTFTVILPQKVMGTTLVGSFKDNLESTKSAQNEYKASFIAPDARILVVDDNEMNLFVAESLMKSTKIQVDTALSGMAALKKLAQNHYDLIFLDQMMPSLDGIQTLKMAQNMEENKNKGVPTIALTANAISGAKEMFLREGFTDYLSKPIDSVALEKMLIEYLPMEKLHAPDETNSKAQKEDTINDDSQFAEESSESNSKQNEELTEKTQTDYEYLNVDLGLQYSAGMEDMYQNILEMFCNLKDEKKAKLQEAFETEDWNNYTTFIHALKSTSLSIGGEKTSEDAKNLETAGKMCISEFTSELEKHESIEYIKQHHTRAMELYDALVEEAEQYLATKRKN